MSGTIEQRITLRDQVTGTLNRINRGTVEYRRNLRDLRDVGEKTWSGIKVGILATGAALVAGAVGIVAASSAWEEAARGAIEAETKLVAVLQNVKGVTDAQVQSIKEYAGELQKLGVIEADTLIAGDQQLATFQLQANTIKTLMPGMADLLAQQKGLNASSGDAVSIGNLLGKSMTGQVGALSKVGISFTESQKKILKFGNEQERAATLAEVLKANVGGVNAALAQTDQGGIQQTINVVGDLEETLGATVLYIKGKFAKAFMGIFPQIETSVTNIATGVQHWAENGGIDSIINGMKSAWAAIQDVWNVAVGTYNFFKDNWSLISPIIYGIAFGLVAYKLALIAVRGWTLATTAATWLMVAAQLGFNAALKANPIGVVITLLGLLVTAGIYVINNWEQVKLTGMKVWNTVVDAAEWGTNMLVKYANFMLRAYKFAWDSIEFAGKSIWNGIISAGEIGVNGFIGLIDKMISKSVEGINVLIRNANDASNALGFGDISSEIKFGGLGRVDFSGAKSGAIAPTWDNNFNPIKSVDFGGAKFSDDSIMTQTRKVQAERDKKRQSNEDKLISAIKDNTVATSANTGGTAENTAATGKNTSALRQAKSAEDIADTLYRRIEREIYATT